jgi:hypothetical protein
MPTTTQTLTVDGVTLTLRLERKSVRNINARLRGEVLQVSAPYNVPQQTLDDVLPDLARRLLRRVRARQINAADNALELAREIAARFPHPPQVNEVIFVTNQEARWGSYSSATRTIRLNATLRLMPRWVLESVVAHELAHYFHHNHSPAFWALCHRVDPYVERARAFLAGVSWLGHRWETLPPVERSILLRSNEFEEAEE